jgi:uncharacterized membrane protein
MRHPEIDLLRTIAIVAMVVYHAAYDLRIYDGWNIAIFEDGWLILARATATLFLLLVGVSFIIAHERSKAKGSTWRRALRRGGIVLGVGLLVTIATWLMDPQTFVRFGILQLIGVSMLLLPFFARCKEGNVLIGAAVITLGSQLKGMIASTSLLLPLGITYPGFQSVDYFPLLPWFGVVLIGAGIGHLIYVRLGAIPFKHPLPAWTTWPGRHSLLVYLVHQPVLLGLMWIVKPVS